MLADLKWIARVPLAALACAAIASPAGAGPTGPDVAQAQGTASIDLIGQYGGPSQVVATFGEFALLGSGRDVAIFDTSGANLAVGPLWSIPLDGTVRDVAVGKGTAYVLVNGNRVHVLDVAGLPATPVVLGHVDAPLGLDGEIEQVVANGQFLYTTGLMGLGVVDVSNPLQPVWVHVLGETGSASLPVVEGNHLFMASNADLLVLDISEPALPRVASRINVVDEGALAGLDVDGGYAALSTWSFVERGSSHPNAPALSAGDRTRATPSAPEQRVPDPAIPTTASLIVVDVRDPLAPVEVDRLDLSGSVETVGRLDVDSGFAYLLATHYAGPWTTYGIAGSMMVADIRSPDQTTLVDDFDWHEDVGADIELLGRRALIAESNGGLRMLGLADQTAPVLEETYDTPLVPRAVAAAAGQVVLGDHGIEGLWIDDASVPSQVRAQSVVSKLDLCLADCDIAFSHSGLAVVADYNQGVLLLDARDPTRPVVGEPLSEARGAVAVDTSGPYPIVVSEPNVSRSSQLHVLDASVLDTQRIVGSTELSGSAADVAYTNDAAFATTSSGLAVVDVGDPRRPVVVAEMAVGGPEPRVAAAGDYVYVVQGDGVIHVLDASEPSTPQEVGWLDKARQDSVRPNQVLSVDVMSGTLFVQHLSWLQAVDVRDPQRPREVAWTYVGGAELVDMDAADGLVYLATRSDGLVIAEMRLREEAALVFLPSVRR